MARWRPNHGFMHIKKRTEGTSNELSFSVLDAKSKNAEQNEASPRTVSELGKVAVFTLPGKQQSGDFAPSAAGFGMSKRQRKNVSKVVSGGTTLGASPEVVNRKQQRRSWRLLNVAAVLALVGALVVVGARTLGSIEQRQQGGEVALASGISLLEQSDEALVALDNAVAAPASEDQTALNQLLSSLSAASSSLDRAQASAESALVQDSADSVKERAALIKEAAAARKVLIEQGRLVLNENAAAKTATNYVERAWAATLEADAAVREVGAQTNDTRTDEISAASEKALDRFQDALVLLRQAKSAYPSADLTNLENYIEMRASAQQNALVINAAQSSQENALVEANIAAYNEAESKAAELAASLPENPAQPIIDRFEQVGGKAYTAYQEARVRAARADEAIRNIKDKQG